MMNVVDKAGLQSAINTVTYEFHFAPTAALATNGVVLPLVASQSSASPFVKCMVGLGDLSTAKITAAAATEMCGKSVKAPAIGEVVPLTTTLAQVATGLKAYLDGIEANADGKYSVAFAVCGIKFSDIVSVQIDQNREAGPAAGVSYRSAQVNGERLWTATVLGATSKFVVDSALTEVALTTSPLIFAPEWDLVAGAFLVAESDNLVLAADQDIRLTIVCKA